MDSEKQPVFLLSICGIGLFIILILAVCLTNSRIEIAELTATMNSQTNWHNSTLDVRNYKIKALEEENLNQKILIEAFKTINRMR